MTVGMSRRVNVVLAAAVSLVLVIPAAASAVVDPSPTNSVNPVAPTPDSPFVEGAQTAATGFEARELAVQTGEPVEVLSERSTSGSLYALPDGQWQWVMASAPQRAQTSGDGTDVDDWSVLDVRLVANGDGSFSPTVHPDSIVIHGGDSQFFSFTSADAGVTVSLSLGEGTVGDPLIDGGRATFADVATDTDLVMEVRPAGYEYFLVAKTPEAAAVVASIPLVLNVSGATIRTTESGGYELVSPQGDVLGSMPPASAWDAFDDLKGGSPVLDDWAVQQEFAPVERAFENLSPEDRVALASEFVAGGESLQAIDTQEVNVDLTTTDAAGTFEVQLSVADDWITDDATAYPVVVDPSGGFEATFDTDVIEGTTTDSSASTQLRLGYDGAGKRARTFISFTPMDLQYATVTKAELWMAEFWSWSCTQKQWDIYAADAASTATRWTNQPPIAATLSGSSTATKGYSSSCATDWVTIDMGGLPQLWASNYAAGTTQSVMLRATNEADAYGWKRFYSANATGGHPTVVVTYTTEPPKAPTGIIVGTQALTAKNMTLLTTTLPQFSANVNDKGMDATTPPTWRPLHALFVLYKDGVMVGSYDGTTTPAGGGVSTWTPTVPLVEGAVYTVMVADVYNNWTVSAGTSGGGTFTVKSLNPPSQPSLLTLNGLAVPTGVVAPGVAVEPTDVPVVLIGARDVIEPGDVDRDGKKDLLVWNTDYSLSLYRGDGAGGVLSLTPTPVAGSWSSYTRIIGPGDWNSDGYVDLITMSASGVLYKCLGTVTGTLVSPCVAIGTDWQWFKDIITPGDFNKDGKADLIVVETGGALKLYGGNGLGGFAAGYGGTIGNGGWQAFTSVLTPGNFNADSYNAPDLIGWTKSTGILSFYAGTGGLPLAGVAMPPNSWTSPVQMIAPGDFTGNGTSDLLSLNVDGTLTVFEGTGTAGVASTGNPVTGPNPNALFATLAVSETNPSLVLTDSTPGLSAIVSDLDGGQVRAVFSLYRSRDGVTWELVRNDLYGTWVTSGARSYYRSTSATNDPGLDAAFVLGQYYRVEVRSQDKAEQSVNAVTTGPLTIPSPAAGAEVPAGCDGALGVPVANTTCAGA